VARKVAGNYKITWEKLHPGYFAYEGWSVMEVTLYYMGGLMSVALTDGLRGPFKVMP